MGGLFLKESLCGRLAAGESKEDAKDTGTATTVEDGSFSRIQGSALRSRPSRADDLSEDSLGVGMSPQGGHGLGGLRAGKGRKPAPPVSVPELPSSQQAPGA